MPTIDAHTIDLETADGPLPVYEVKAPAARTAVVVIQEAFGVTVPIVPATPETLVERLRPLVESFDERRRLGEAGRAYVEQVHDIDKLADRLIEVYESL